MVTDPISDFIIQIKNACMVGKEHVSIPYSKFKFAVANKLRDSGYVKSVTKRGKKARKNIEIELIYNKDGTPRINDVARLSKPSRRIYKGASAIRPVKYGTGSLILSTPKGILTDREAKKEKVGGEALFEIW